MFAPLAVDTSYDDIDITLEEFARCPDRPPWNFFLHAECWNILLDRVPEGRKSILKFSAILANWLYCSTWNRYRYLRPGHDFGGALQFQKPARYPPRIITEKGYAFLLAEPSRPRTLAQVLDLSDGESLYPARAHAVLPQVSPRNQDVFSCLPVEVLNMLLAIMPSTDIKNLRAGSRFVASVPHPTSLSQQFWRSRFCLDSELGFVLPAEPSGNNDWRAAFYATWNALSIPDKSLELKNRRRIWNIVGVNEPLFTAHMLGERLNGIPSPDYCKRSQELNYSACQPSGKLVATEISSEAHPYSERGSKKIFDRAIILPLDKFNVSRMWASTITFNSEEFISGLVFELSDASSNSITTCRLGYISPRPKLVAELSSLTRLAGFELATQVNGITGVRAFLKDSSTASHSSWVGNKGNGDSRVAFGTLLLYRDQHPIHLIAQFDVSKSSIDQNSYTD